MEFILIVFFSTYGHYHGGVTFQEFKTLETCKTAQEFIVNNGEKGWNSTPLIVSKCIQK